MPFPRRASQQTNVQALAQRRRAWNARTFSLTLFVLGVFACLTLSVLPNRSELSGIIAVVGVASLFQGLAYLLVRRRNVVVGAMLMITAALSQHVVIAAAHPTAALVTPFFASIFVMIAATCLTRKWLTPVSLLTAVAIAAQWVAGKMIGLDDLALQGPYIASAVLTSVTTVVAWLHVRGLDRALAVAQAREDEREELFLELEKAARMEALGRLAGGIAHDFNNLLVVIQGSTDFARDHIQDSPEALEELNQVEAAAKRAGTLTSQLLAFSRRQVVPSTLIDPSQVIRELEPLLARLLGSKMRLSLDLEESEARVLASASQLEQVVMNLAANARDASDDGGSLTITLRTTRLEDRQVADLPPGEYVQLLVQDEGSGIPAEVMDHLFEPFFTTKEVGRGTGLGLATSFGIIHQMGGLITAESEEGEGATFQIYIPVARADAPVSVTKMIASSAPQRALVIDDDPRVRSFVDKLLTAEGTKVIQAGDQASSLSAAREAEKLDLIVTDVVLSQENGLKTLDELRALHPEARMVVMSSFSPEKSVMKRLESLDVGFLPKPFSKDTFRKITLGQPSRSPPPKGAQD